MFHVEHLSVFEYKESGLKIKDYYFSGEEFELIKVEEGILKTNPVPKDIEKYYASENYISHKKKNKTAFEVLYSIFQKFNFNYKYKVVSKYKKKGKLLDYGCGNASFLEYMKKKKYSCFGYEPNVENTSENITIIDSLENTKEVFDIITLWHVLEHIENPKEILNLLKSKLTKEGILIIAIPNYGSYDAKYYKEFWAAWDVPRHIYHYSKNGAISFFTKNQWYIEKIFPLPIDSFYVSWLSAKYKNSVIEKMKTLFIAQKSNIKSYKSGNWSSLIYILRKP